MFTALFAWKSCEVDLPIISRRTPTFDSLYHDFIFSRTITWPVGVTAHPPGWNLEYNASNNWQIFELYSGLIPDSAAVAAHNQLGHPWHKGIIQKISQDLGSPKLEASLVLLKLFKSSPSIIRPHNKVFMGSLKSPYKGRTSNLKFLQIYSSEPFQIYLFICLLFFF